MTKRHDWYGPELYREPRSHTSAAIQMPIYPNPERWISGVLNARLKDDRAATIAQRKPENQ